MLECVKHYYIHLRGPQPVIGQAAVHLEISELCDSLWRATALRFLAAQRQNACCEFVGILSSLGTSSVIHYIYLYIIQQRNSEIAPSPYLYIYIAG